MRFFPSLRIALVTLFLLFTAGMTVNFLLLAQSGVKHLDLAATGPSPKDAAASAQALINERFENLAAKALAIAESPALKLSLGDPRPSPVQVADVARELAPAANTALLVVVNPAGVPLYDSRVDGAPKDPTSWAFTAGALQSSSERSYFLEGGRLYQAVAVPVLVPGKVLGAVAVGFALDSTAASQWKSLTGNEVLVFSSGKCLVTTSPQLFPASGVEKELVPNLPGGTSVSPAAPNVIQMEFQGRPVEGSYLVLHGTGTSPVGAVFFIKPRMASPRLPWWPFLAAGSLWLALGLSFSIAASRLASHPLKKIQKVVDQASDGDLKGVAELPDSHEAGPLARAVNRFLSGTLERELFRNILGKHAPRSAVKKLLASGDPPALQGERRETVILYCGIRGFSSFSENADPAKLSKGLNDFFTLMSNIVFKHEGMIDKFMGDTFMAIWGAPLAQEDAEMKAVKAALEMQESLKEFNAERVKQNLHPMMVGIGITAGEVVAGNLGSEQNPDYTVIGEEVALASKLAAKASAGQIVLADSAFQKVKDRVEVNPLAPIVQKGIAIHGVTDPVRIHVVTDLRMEIKP